MADHETKSSRREMRLAKRAENRLAKAERSAAVASPRNQEKTSKLLRGFLLFICIVLAFGLGFLARSSDPLMEYLGIPTSSQSQEVNPGATVSGNTDDSVSARVAEVQGILESYSLDKYNLDEMTAVLMDSFVKTSEDPYLRYFDEDRYNAYVKEQASNSNAGIGVLFAEDKGHAYAADIFEGSSAAAAGVVQGDYVVAIGGTKQEQWTVSEVINTLAAEEGETVLITWSRPAKDGSDNVKEFSTTLNCAEYYQTNVTSQLSDHVGIISITQFTDDSADLVSKAVKELTGDGADCFVLDLRDCSGGYLTQAVDIANLFISSGSIVQIQTKEGTSAKTAEGKVITTCPLVVLINGKTASTAEVLAAALKESGKFQLVGEPTMGKGSVQVVRELSFGGAIRYTAAYYLTPSGKNIDEKGVNPTVEVANDSSNRDNQRNVAVEMAQSQVTVE